MSGLSHQQEETAQQRRRWVGPALILLAAAAATVPIVHHGTFCGDDFEFHVVGWFDALQSWRHGIVYPHWMPSANYDAGEPRFIFYPPLTWMLGAVLGVLLPWAAVPVAMIFLILAGTGLATRALAREALPDGAATLAGCAALFSGYALFTAYERTAFAELTGGFWIPLLLLFALRGGLRPAALRGSRRITAQVVNRTVIALALVVAGAWLSNGPVGVMGSYLLAAVAVVSSALARSWMPLLRSSFAAALGMALAAIYLIPAAREQSWADLHAAIDYPVFKIENNWFFAQHRDALLAPFGMVLHRASMIGAGMMGVAFAAVLLLWLRRKYARPSGAFAWLPGLARQTWWLPLALIPCAVLFLQLPASAVVWNLLPKLRFLQYPWRWLLVLEAPMAVLFAAAVWPASKSGAEAHARARATGLRAAVIAVCAIFFATSTAMAGRTFLRACQEGDTVADLLSIYNDGGGLEGTDEYEAAGSDHWKIAKDLPDACFVDDSDTVLGVADVPNGIPQWRPSQKSCAVTATASLREPEALRLSLVAPRDGFLILRLATYPAWRITVNGKLTEVPNSSNPDPNGPDPRDDGLVAVAVPRGAVEVSARWTATPDVIAGRWVSGLALMAVLVLLWLSRTRTKLRARLSIDAGQRVG
jgi:hypothetical protein